MLTWPRDCPLAWCAGTQMDAEDYRQHLERDHS